MEDEEFDAFVGVDWGEEEYEVCVLDGREEVLARNRIAHSGEAIGGLADWLAKTAKCAPDRIAVAIEIKRGALVTELMERSCAVFFCNPKQSNRFRDRHSLSGKKDDRLDAFVLADAVLKDRKKLRRIEPSHPQVPVLRELVKQHHDLTTRAVALGHQLRAQFHRYFPQMLQLPGPVDAAWKLDLWEKAPTPEKAARLRRTTVEKILSRRRIRKVTAEQVVETLRQPKLKVAPGVTEAAVIGIRVLLPQITLVREQRSHVDREMDRALETFGEEEQGEKNEQRDVEILRQLPGAGRLVVATLLAEAHAELLARDYQELRKLSGVAPVTIGTGKQCARKKRTSRQRKHKPKVRRRLARNARLSQAMHYWGAGAATHDLYWRARLKDQLSRGQSMGTACRNLANSLLRTACACLRDGVSYDPSKKSHAALAA